MSKKFRLDAVLQRTVVLWMLVVVIVVAGQDAASLLTGLLSTFATSSITAGCSGECRHAISALFCTYVDQEGDCGDPQLRCCTDPPPSSSTSQPFFGANASDTYSGTESRPDEPSSVSSNRRPPVVAEAPPISLVTNLTVRPGANRPGSPRPSGRPGSKPGYRRRPTTTITPQIGSTVASVASQNSATSTSTSSVFSAPATTPTAALALPQPSAAALTGAAPNKTPCKGMCVSNLVSSLCSSISEYGHCSPGETCCLMGGEGEEEDIQNDLPSSTVAPKVPSTTKFPVGFTTRPTAEVTASVPVLITKSVTKTPVPESKEKPTRPPPPKSTLVVTTKAPVPNVGDAGDECPGSCVMGFLSRLCDVVLDAVKCENGGKCCISKNPENTDNGSGNEQTVKPALQNCPGICLPMLLSGVCNRPAVLIPETLDCESGTICCDNSLREEGVPLMTSTTPSSSLFDFLTRPLTLGAVAGALGNKAPGSGSSKPGAAGSSPAASLLGQSLAELFGAGSGGASSNKNDRIDTQASNGPFPRQPIYGIGQAQNIPPSFPNRKPPLNVDTSVDRIHVGAEKPPCPGTCIPIFLKMTCFGSSQVTDSFDCPKKNLVCCALKSSSGPGSEIDSANVWNSTYFNSPNSHMSNFHSRPSNKYVCGIKGAIRPETPRVVGGRDASPGEWCWQVALINSLNQYLCGGALIGRQWVLTAAHCVTNLIRSGDAIYVRIGDYDLTSKYGSPGAQTLRVATTYIHHNHNSQTLDNNIALLKLEKQVDLKEGVCLVCLPARGVSVESGKRCVVTGYGYMGESGPIPLRIREAVLPIVNDQECVRKINSVTEKIFILPASSFCAGGEEGHDACQGDGGGPLSCEVDGYYEITGIVSWGFGCGRADVPGIYVKVSSFIGWINQIISVNSI